MGEKEALLRSSGGSTTSPMKIPTTTTTLSSFFYLSVPSRARACFHVLRNTHKFRPKALRCRQPLLHAHTHTHRKRIELVQRVLNHVAFAFDAAGGVAATVTALPRFCAAAADPADDDASKPSAPISMLEDDPTDVINSTSIPGPTPLTSSPPLLSFRHINFFPTILTFAISFFLFCL